MQPEKKIIRKCKYRTFESPEELVKYMAKGLSNLEIAAKFDIAEKTFYEWLKNYPEFQEAYDKGDPKRFAFLMQKGDQIFLEEKNDKGYKHWQNKVNYMYKNYRPEPDRSGTTNNIQIGNINMLEYKDKSEAQLYEILQTKISKIKTIDGQSALTTNLLSYDQEEENGE